MTVRSIYSSTGDATAECNAGEVATGGGAYPDDGATTVAFSQPDPSAAGSVPTGWFGHFQNRTIGVVGTGTVYVVCAKR